VVLYSVRGVVVERDEFYKVAVSEELSRTDSELDKMEHETGREHLVGRVLEALDEVKASPQTRKDRLSFEQYTLPSENGNLEFRMIKNCFQFSIPAKGFFPINNRGDSSYLIHTAIGTRELERRQSDTDGWTRGLMDVGVDILSWLEYRADDGTPRDSYPFEDIQTLERLDWDQPVFSSVKDKLYYQFQAVPIVNEDAYTRAQGNVGGVLLRGMEASLNDWELFNSTYEVANIG
jgi:hypothetical protein